MNTVQQWIRQIAILSWQIKTLVGLLWLILTVGLVSVLLWWPMVDRLEQARQQEQLLKTRYSNRYQHYLDLMRIKHQQQQLQQHLSDRLSFLKQPFVLADITQKLVESLTVSHLTLVSITPGKRQQQQGLIKQNVKLVLSGSAEQLMHWLWIVAQQSWLLQVNQLTLAESHQTLHIDLEMSLYHG